MIFTVNLTHVLAWIILIIYAVILIVLGNRR